MRGCEWVVEAYGCDPARLADANAVRSLFDRIIAELSLHPVAAPVFHTFPAPGGVTALVALAESHLTVHTFPEHGSLSLNLFCCVPRPEWPWAARLAEWAGAGQVEVRYLERPYGVQERRHIA